MTDISLTPEEERRLIDRAMTAHNRKRYSYAAEPALCTVERVRDRIGAWVVVVAIRNDGGRLINLYEITHKPHRSNADESGYVISRTPYKEHPLSRWTSFERQVRVPRDEIA